ncbi:MAG: peptidase S8, partial [Eudoraea sp.]
MIFKNLKSIFYSGLIAIILAGCGATNIVSTPIENIDSVSPKITELTKEEQKTWGHDDLMQDTVPGISLD